MFDCSALPLSRKRDFVSPEVCRVEPPAWHCVWEESPGILRLPEQAKEGRTCAIHVGLINETRLLGYTEEYSRWVTKLNKDVVLALQKHHLAWIITQCKMFYRWEGTVRASAVTDHQTTKQWHPYLWVFMILFEKEFSFCLETQEGASEAPALQGLEWVTLLGDLVRLFTCLNV